LPILIFVLSISLFGYGLQDTGFSHELVSLVLGGLVTMMGFVLISGWLKKDNQDYAPKLCRILPLQSSPVKISPAIPITSID
jgi:positive regulator of sigma E activity